MTEPDMTLGGETSAEGNVEMTPVPPSPSAVVTGVEGGQLTPMGRNQARIIQVLSDRLKGNGAWNGQGLLVFLATTSRKDKERLWMEPLRDLAVKVVYAYEDNEPIPELTQEELEQVDQLIDYSEAFHAAIAANAEE